MRGRSTSSSLQADYREALPRNLGSWSWAAQVALPRASAALVSPCPPPTARPPSRRAPRLVGHLVVLSQLSSALAAPPCLFMREARICGALGAVDWLCGPYGASAGSAPAVRRQCASCSGSAALKRPTALWGRSPEALEAPPLCLSLLFINGPGCQGTLPGSTIYNQCVVDM